MCWDDGWAEVEGGQPAEEIEGVRGRQVVSREGGCGGGGMGTAFGQEVCSGDGWGGVRVARWRREWVV